MDLGQQVDMCEGWPFLVARGRTEGYRSILVPAFLSGTRSEDALADSVRSPRSSADEPLVDVVPTTFGDVTIVYRPHRLQPEDLDGDPGAGGVVSPDDDRDALTTDAHGRPIDLSYGFAVRGQVSTVSNNDLRSVRGTALAAYRAFLVDERSFVTMISEPFALRSRVTPAAPEPPTREQARAGARHDSLPREPRPAQRDPVESTTFVGIAVALVVVLLGIAWLVWRPTAPPLTVTDAVCGPTAAGETDVACTVELEWRGPGPLRIEDARVRADDATPPAEPQIRNDCNSIIAANGRCRIEVAFAQQIPAEGLVLSVGHDAGDPLRIPLAEP